jgi:serine/threonine protein kinase
MDTKTVLQGNVVLEDLRAEAAILEYLHNGKTGSHPNIAGFVDQWEDDKLHYLATEFIQGPELCDFMMELAAQSQILDERSIHKLFTQAVNCTQFLHSKGVYHLDISCENMLLDLTSEPTVKFIDFGLARHNTNPEFAPVKGPKPGKLSYMAPEILHELDFNGVLADTWSLGVFLFILCTGEPPFRAPTRGDPVYRALYYGKLKQLADKNGRWILSESQCDLLCKMLAPPQRRISLEDVKSHPWVSSSVSDVAHAMEAMVV